jgi:polysaccharide export outer membrane protein
MDVTVSKGYFLAGLLVIICCWATLPAAMADDSYRLAAGDRVKIVVFGHADLSGDYEVNSDGLLSLPLIKSVQAAGLTVLEIEQIITSRLKPAYLKNPLVGVAVLEHRPFYILGEVKNPGSYPYTSNMTVVAAVALAGGYTYRARKSRISIIRADDPEKQRVRVDQNTFVRPGDIIEVPERFF